MAWGGAAAIGVANAVLRQAAFSNLSELPAHQLSTVTLLVFLAAYMWAVERWRELPSTRTAVQVGLLWAGLTVLFEFVLGLYVTKRCPSCSPPTTSRPVVCGRWYRCGWPSGRRSSAVCTIPFTGRLRPTGRGVVATRTLIVDAAVFTVAARPWPVCISHGRPRRCAR
jgi:hypothetical protein